MIIKSIQRNVVESHDFKSEIATIDANEMRYISSLLRNNYSNTILATARETIANAVDANKGSSRCIEITAPSRLSPTFVVRDFGAGLSEADLFGLYTKYGRSTKRSDNGSIGGFGIGRFAPLSYTDSFTVTSRHDSIEIVVSVYVDESGDTRFTKLSETSTSEPSGLEVSVAIKSEDVVNFQTQIDKVIRYSDHEFVCKNFSRQLPQWVIKNAAWGVEEDKRGNTPIVVMGGVSYPLNLDSLSNHPFADSKIYKAFQHSYIRNFFVFFFPVGSLALHHSRENLEYNTQTKNLIARAIVNLETDIKSQIQKEINLITDSEKFFVKVHSFTSAVGVESFCCVLDLLFTDANKNVFEIKKDDIVPLAIYRKSRITQGLVRVTEKTKSVEKTIDPKEFYAARNCHIVINDDVKGIQARVNNLMMTAGIQEVIYVVSLADAENKLLYKYNSCSRIHLASKLTPVLNKNKNFGIARKIFSSASYCYSFKEKVPVPTEPFYYLELKHTGGNNYDIIFGDLKDFSQGDLRMISPIAKYLGINYDNVYGILDKNNLPDYAINLRDVFVPKFKAAIAKFKSFLNLKEEKQFRHNKLPMISHCENFRKGLPSDHPLSIYFDAWNASDNVSSHGFSDEQVREFGILGDLPRKYVGDDAIPVLDSKIVEKINKEVLTIKETYPMVLALFEGRYGSFYGVQNVSKLVIDYINLVDNRKS